MTQILLIKLNIFYFLFCPLIIINNLCLDTHMHIYIKYFEEKEATRTTKQ